MSGVQIGAAVFGFLVIAVTVWQIIKNGVAPSNGKIPEKDNSWFGPH